MPKNILKGISLDWGENDMVTKIFKKKFIAFVDILGFKNKVETAETGEILLETICEMQKRLGTDADRTRIAGGTRCCPESKYIQFDLDFQITQVSDCVIVSCEISPAGAINIISYCSEVVMNLLEIGVMCRGYITTGLIYHTESNLFGTGYQKVYKYEDDGNVKVFSRTGNDNSTPFVEIDREICNYVKECGDQNVLKHFTRMVRDNGKEAALFPFKFLAGGYIVGLKSNEEIEQSYTDRLIRIEELKKIIKQYISVDDPKTIEKGEYYIKELDKCLESCQAGVQLSRGMQEKAGRPISDVCARAKEN